MPINKKPHCFIISFILMFFLISTCIFPDGSFAAAKDQVDNPTTTTFFQSSASMENDYCKATVKGKKMTIEFKTMLPTAEFRISLWGVVPRRRFTDLDTFVTAQYMGQASGGQLVYGFKHTIDFSKTKVKDGQYFLFITRIGEQTDAYENDPQNGGMYKNLYFKLTKGTPQILKYDDVIAENQRVKEIGAAYDPSWYLDETLSDIRFTLKIPSTTIYKEMSPYKINFMRRMSDQITAGATNDYDKLLKIYEYVAGEFYYDTIAYKTHSYQYANPYDNLYNHVNKVSSPNSDYQGRVATTCQGYSAIVVSLARAQGIPARFVFGHRTTSPLNSWATEKNIGKKDHWWVEAYVNGRWIFIDPTIGTSNKYNKNTKEWQYYGLTNYTYFDPSDEQIAVSHIYHNIYPEKRFGYLITDKYEIDKLTAFLNTTTDGKTNGKIMNPAYSQYDKSTWGDGFKANFMTDAYGKTGQIQWSNKGFKGNADFSGFTQMKVFSMHHNQLESINLDNCTNLETIRLYNNKLKSVTLKNTKKLKTADISDGNRLKNAYLYANDKNIHITAGNHGAFQLKYDTSNRREVEILFKPEIGYKVEGLYNGDNKKLSENQHRYFTHPTYQNYHIKFALNPKSYKHYLYEGRNDSLYLPYTTALQNRLKSLGYYQGSVDGIYDAEVTEAVRNFQHINNIDVSGKIGSTTWGSLFSSNARKMQSQEVLTQVKDFHAQRIMGEISQLEVKDKKETKDKVILSWHLENPLGTKPDGYQVWKSTKSNSGFTKLATTKKTILTNTSDLKKGYRYYYKIRGYKTISGKTYYTPWEQLDIKIPKPVKKPKPDQDTDKDTVTDTDKASVKTA